MFDSEGVKIYSSKGSAGDKDGVPFLVRVTIENLNIRSGPGTEHARTGMFTGKGIFTIVEVRDGKGSSAGWGRLKSGAGWIALSYVERI